MFTNKYRFIVLPRLGLSIHKLVELNKNQLQKIDVLKLGIQLLEKIEAFHNIGYVHLDIKPDNILLNRYSHHVKNSNTSENSHIFSLHENMRLNSRKLSFYLYPDKIDSLISSEVSIIDFGTATNYISFDNNNRRLKIHLPNKPVPSSNNNRNNFFASKHYFSG